MNAVVKENAAPISLDIGCGKNKRAGWVGIDAIKFDGVDIVHDVRSGRWPFEDNSVAESQASHFLEHLTNFGDKWERVHFFNELWRITVPGGKCTLVFPHWASNRFYGDPTHKEAISEMAFYYLDPAWRDINAPHADSRYNPNGYSCHWACSWGYYLDQPLTLRNPEYQEFAKRYFKEACSDMVVTMEAVKK
jgi:hypothetical protein